MKSPALLFLCLFALASSVASHGSPFTPIPPSPDPAPGKAPPSAPTAPGSPSRPAAPSTPAGPPAPKTGSGGSNAANTGTISVDPTSWEMWWLYNQDRFLGLKAHIEALDVRTGGDTDWLTLASAGGPPSADVIAERVVPALLALYERERSNDVLTSATVALARLADGPLAARAGEFSRAFAPFVSDSSQEVGETAVLGRGLVGDESSAVDLAQILSDTPDARRPFAGKAVPPRTRAFAAYALGFLASRSRNEDVRRYIVHHLVTTLHAERGATSDVHVACVLALGLAPLAFETRSSNGPASAIASASRQTQLQCLLRILVDSQGDRFVRAHACASLARLAVGADPKTCGVITDALSVPLSANSEEKAEVVQGAVLALGHIADVDERESDARVRATLQRLAVAGERQVRAFALIALGQRAARAADVERAGETRIFLAKRLNEGRSSERAWAALALGILEHGRPVPNETNALSVRATLLSALNDCGSPDELGALAIACGLARETGAVPVLLDRLERSSDARVQGYLAVALGLTGDQRAVGPLRALLTTARFRTDLLRQTAIGLALLEDRTLVPVLLETLERASSLAAQSAAASVIGWIGDQRALPGLLALLQNREATASARGFAAVALGRVCDRDRVPWNALICEDVHYRAATVTLNNGDGTGLLEIL